MTDWSLYNDFSAWEFACRCGCGDDEMDHSFMFMLQALRDDLGMGMTISSGKRCAIHNDAVSSTGLLGPHTSSKAADILCYGEKAFRIQCLLGDAHPFTGIGVKQHGPHKDRFIHLDILLPSETEGPRPWAWSYR